MIAFGNYSRQQNNNGMKSKKGKNRFVENLIIEYSLRYHSLKSTYNKRRYTLAEEEEKNGRVKCESLFYKQTNENTIKPEE